MSSSPFAVAQKGTAHSVPPLLKVRGNTVSRLRESSRCTPINGDLQVRNIGIDAGDAKQREAEKVALASLMATMMSRRPAMTAARLSEISRVASPPLVPADTGSSHALPPPCEPEASKTPSENGASVFRFDQGREGMRAKCVANIRRLVRNRNRLRDISPPKICPGYRDLIATPARVLRLPGEGPDTKVNASYTFEYGCALSVSPVQTPHANGRYGAIRKRRKIPSVSFVAPRRCGDENVWHYIAIE